MKKQDHKIAAVLVAASAFLHLVYLGHPNQVVFDEVHFGKFVTAYCCTHQNFFDIHPPHAKLLIAGTAWLGGYRGGFSFENIGQAYGSVPIEWLRLAPAIAGTLLPAVIFILLRLLGAGPRLAGLGGVMVLLENATLVQTRMIALDGILLLATFASLTLYLAAEKLAGWRQYVAWAGAGSLAGLALGTKFTGLAIVALLGVMLAGETLGRWRKRASWVRLMKAGGVIASAGVATYLLGWAIHFSLLSLPGSGDAFHKNIFNGNIVADFARETVALHKIMLSANYGLKATHAYASAWWQWPVMSRSVFYWQDNGRMIYFLGNPAVWWGSGALLAAAAFGSMVWFGKSGGKESHGANKFVRLWIPMAGYLISLAPLMRVPRSLFLYHYLTPLFFGVIAGILWLEALGWRYRSKIWYQVVVGSLAGLIIVGFIWWSPLTFGLEVDQSWSNRLFLLKGWR